MLFSLQPKTDSESYYNYSAQFSQFKSYLDDRITRLIVVKGLRRAGKTSFSLTALAKLRKRHIAIDARSLGSNTRSALEKRILSEFKQTAWLPKRILAMIKGVEIGGSIAFSSPELGLWDYLKSEETVLFIDEAQELKGTGCDKLLAAIYDGTRTKLVVSGSEVGLLDEFLGNDDPKAPLFGRGCREIVLERLHREKSLDFLERGFQESGVSKSSDELSDAVDQLDGIIGWLTLYGFYSLKMEHKAALSKTLKMGTKLIKEEFSRFLSLRLAARARYDMIMKAVCRGYSSWSEVRNYLSANGELVSDPQLANFLAALQDYGFVTKEDGKYFPADPIVKKNWL
jgi:AAA+ ATPase superfamily predicted ATPase